MSKVNDMEMRNNDKFLIEVYTSFNCVYDTFAVVNARKTI